MSVGDGYLMALDYIAFRVGVNPATSPLDFPDGRFWRILMTMGAEAPGTRDAEECRGGP